MPILIVHFCIRQHACIIDRHGHMISKEKKEKTDRHGHVVSQYKRGLVSTGERLGMDGRTDGHERAGTSQAANACLVTRRAAAWARPGSARATRRAPEGRSTKDSRAHAGRACSMPARAQCLRAAGGGRRARKEAATVRIAPARGGWLGANWRRGVQWPKTVPVAATAGQLFRHAGGEKVQRSSACARRRGPCGWTCT